MFTKITSSSEGHNYQLEPKATRQRKPKNKVNIYAQYFYMKSLRIKSEDLLTKYW